MVSGIDLYTLLSQNLMRTAGWDSAEFIPFQHITCDSHESYIQTDSITAAALGADLRIALGTCTLSTGKYWINKNMKVLLPFFFKK